MHHKLAPFFVPILREGHLAPGNKLIVGHNLSFDHKWSFHHWGLRLERVFDTLWAHKGLTVGWGAFERASLKDAAFYHLGREMSKEERSEFIDADADTFEPSEQAIRYAFLDGEIVLDLMDEMLPKIKRLGIQDALKLRFDMVPIVGDLELRGAPVDYDGYASDVELAKKLREEVQVKVVDQLTPPVLEWRLEEYDAKLAVWNAYRDEYAAVKADHEATIIVDPNPDEGFDTGDMPLMVKTKAERRALINEANRKWKEAHKAPPKPALDSGPINLNSSQQVLNALWRLGYKFKTTRADEFEEYADFLEEQGGDDPLIEPFLTYKRLQKIVSAFGDPILAKIEDGAIRPSWNLMVSTGRMSCRSPNLQQVPKPVRVGEHVIDLRKHFKAPPGFVIGRLDFSNIEMRIAADLSGDPQMIADFLNNADMHGRTAARKLDISYEEGQRLKAAHDEAFNDVRDWAKIKNFGTLYGAWDEEYIEIFSSTYPEMWHFLQQQGYQAIRTKLSRAADGFVKHWVLDPEPNKKLDKDAWMEWRKLRNRIMRQAKNLPIQSTSAAIVMAAAKAVREFLMEQGLWEAIAWVWNIVHDELDLLLRMDIAEEVMAKVKAVAEQAGQRFLSQVPVVAEINLGPFWTK